MIGVEMKGLIEKCNTFCTQALNMAAGMTVNRRQYEVTVEHVLLACLEDPASDISLAVARAGGDAGRIRGAINNALEDFRTGNSGRPVFSPVLQELLEASWLVASVDLGISRIRSGAMLMAFLRRPSFYAQGGYASELACVNREELQQQFKTIIAASIEDSGSVASASASTGGIASAGRDGESFIAKFCEDFTAKAKAGKMDPVFGRDPEIRQMVDILARRRKNNPILVGEPGVGKTAVLEGLALRIVQDDVPETLKGVTLLGLDMGLLEAGASVKGEFERRLKGVLDEIKGSETPIVLFIDEAHLLVGAGNASGGSDAANLMKPALARGEIRTCAATTWKEYKKYFEKDPALARRFQLVKLDEPSVATSALILRGLRDSYERVHKVVVRDDALQVAAEYAGRYITGRFLPDKAVDLLDTACARVKVGLAAKPAQLEDTERAMQACTRELNALKRDIANGVDINSEHMQELEASMTDLKNKADRLETRWREEKEAANAVIAARTAMQEAIRENAPELDSARAAYAEARAALEKIQGNEPLIAVEVSPEVVARVVSDWTGIPVGKVAREQASMVSELDEVLKKRIQGQDTALAAVVEGIQASKAGLRSPSQPIGVFLLVGPSGVGKTETGLALADALFGDERSVVTINMSEFQEKHTVSRLIGSPPGYVGYGEGGMLTEAVRRRPYTVVLLDEVEKAHKDVMQLFYQVFDKGTLTDGEGTEVSFRNTVIMLTSNLGSEIIQEMTASLPEGESPDIDAVASAIRPLLSQHFQPALLARMGIVPYVSLNAAALQRISLLKLNSLARRLEANNKMKLTWADNVPEIIASRCTEVETGARNIDYILSANVLPQLSRNILLHMADGNMPTGVHLSMAEDGTLAMTFAEQDKPKKKPGKRRCTRQ